MLKEEWKMNDKEKAEHDIRQLKHDIAWKLQDIKNLESVITTPKTCKVDGCKYPVEISSGEEDTMCSWHIGHEDK